VAAGNGTPDQAPSAYANLDAVVVGANGRDGTMAPYSLSLSGTKWGLLAPGGTGGDPRDPGFLAQNVVSANWVEGQSNSYGASSGTSIAAPHVAGALALLLAQGLNRDVAIRRMLDNAADAGPCGRGCHGRLDVARAVGSGRDVPPPSAVRNEAQGSSNQVGADGRGADPAPADTKVAPPNDPVVGAPRPGGEPLPVDQPGGDTSERSLALLPEPGSSLRLAASSGSDALVPRNLLFLVVSMTMVSSVLLEWMARRDRRA